MTRILVFLVALGACAAPARAAEMLAPDALARSVTDEVVKILRTDKELAAGNQKKVAEIIETKVAPHFEFTSMARLAMGRNWKQATPDQHKALSQEFRTLLVRTYTTAFTQYKDQTIEYRPVKLAPGENDVVVKSLIKQPSGQPVSVDYRMEKTDTGWKVYDVKIEGISLVENYRNTFNSEVQRSGIDGLIKSLADKNKSSQAPAAK
ncbi:MAG TPA: ABC transporter substrate-binding protein [Burkholderiales bacterium]|jgi:phospholipid transport system substrate-binding protein|nr:ABC transporter substrate-binding protein [Burkholderiales bacterium]